MSAKLVTRRNTLKNIITRAIAYANGVNADTHVVEIQTRLQLLDSTFDRILNVQIDINAVTGTEAIEFEDIEFDAIQALYESAKIKMVTELERRAQVRQVDPEAVAADRFRNLHMVQQQQQPQQMEIKLPSLQIPKFNGDYTLWTSFRDLFDSSIGNRNNLSGAQKLHYLKSFLEDDAAQLVRSYQVTDANFAVAWAALDNRYNNKRLLVTAQFKKLFEQPASTIESAASIRKLIDTTTECVRALTALDLPTEHWSSVIVFIVSQRLDVETHKQWELSLTHNDVPTFEQLTTFMEQRCRSLEAVLKHNAMQPSSSLKKSSASSSRPKASFHVNTARCRVCTGDHLIASCDRFKRMRVYDRRVFVQRQRLCFNCFDSQHLAPDCSESSCSNCTGKHHTLLHFERKATGEKQQQVAEPVTTHFGEMEAQILLSTAYVKVFGTNERIRVLLDSGSQASFITEDCVQRLRLSRKAVSVPVSGLGASNAGKANSLVCLQIQSCIDNNFVVELKALVLKQLTGMLPSKEIASENRSKYSGIVLADPEYFRPGHIDMLIGADIYGKLLLDGLIPGNGRTATAQNTSLGWILLGAVPDLQQSSSICNVGSVLNLHLELEADLRKFWELEEVNVAKSLTRNEEMCESHFLMTHTRDESGRYVVRLPFDESVGALGNSRNSAVRRLLQVEKRLYQNASLKQQYQEFMREYAALGHMQLATQWANSDADCYYLPHHCVIKESSSTTKLRVVFDASCKTSTGISLNDKQLTGPKLQDDLFSIIVRFRQHAIALTADIAKMYRQVLVDGRDLQYQRIVWRDNVTDDISDWMLNTVTYGMAAAPYLAIRSLRQLAIDEATKFPVASNVVLSDFYVDDMITGCDSVEDASNLQADLRKLLNCGGFELRKWSSNNNCVLNLIPAEQRESDGPLNLSEDAAVKTLGLNWHPTSDSFGFVVKVPEIDHLVTKRAILSVVARLFDPLGFLSPTIVVAKMLLQKLWTLGIGWDDEVPTDIRCHWLAYCGELTKLQEVRIPRWLGTSRHQKCEIHAFCDASEAAYAAVVYVKCLMDNGTVRISLISAKSKVAPIKQQTMPRLELCAAVLLTRLIEYVGETLELVGGVNYYAWSDSQVVLSWLKKIPRTWKTFVANRVASIQLSPIPMKWKYVPSESNPADCASRGVMPQDLENHPLWFSGPDWLRFDATCWPAAISATNETSTEKREVKALAAIIIEDWSLLNNYSDLQRLKRITAYVMRFVSNIRRRRTQNEPITSELTAEELQRALKFWLIREQSTEFASELAQCKRGEPLKRSSKLLSLNPFVDADGLLRVGGRLKLAMFQGQAHPIILPIKNTLTNLIIADIHIKLLHGGIQLMLSYLRRSYWIVGARSRIRMFIHRCVICFRQRPKTCQQLMGSLPAERATPCRPFQRSGVDYAGPILLKSSNGRGNRTIKAYIALFVCFATKAVHLEIVSDLTTSAFLAALQRFTARRGKCSDLFSDCGTNFVGAKREIGEIQSLLRSKAHLDAVCRVLANDGTNWHMIPPGSPHFGGLWEAGIKSVKNHLRRIVGQQRLTFEEMGTTLAEIEACLNSRPLCAQTDDPDDLMALTPGHFLIGEAPMIMPDRDLSDMPVSRLTRWKMVKQLTQKFWHRWNQEYIVTLQQRPKWRETRANVQVGQLALIKDERLPPAKWLLGRITATHTGADGKVRVADIKYNGGTTSRTINKLCILPIEI